MHFIIGFVIGFYTLISGMYMDLKYDRQELTKLKNKHRDLYNKMYNSCIINLLLISPIYFTFCKFFVSDTLLFSGLEVFYGVVFHNVYYYIVHQMMHNNKYLKKIHTFHHNFKDVLVPSSANAVSYEEMVLVYLTPFMLFSLFTYPMLGSLIIIILLISTFNLIVHSKHMSKYRFLKIFVSPGDHIDHHTTLSGHYSAPIFNFDNLAPIHIR